MKDEDRYKLYFGPYLPPKTRRGRRLFDEIRGTVIVSRFSDGHISWPKHGRSLILCGDLVKAVRRESILAIRYWWGVSRSQVDTWRRTLGVNATEGTYRLRSAWSRETVKKNIPLLSDPVYCTRRALRRRRMGLPARSDCRQWTSYEDSMLGTVSDVKLGIKFGCSRGSVARRRYMLGIAPFRKSPVPTKNILLISPAKLRARRLALKLRQRDVIRSSGVVTYGTLEYGLRKNISPQAVERLATTLKCRPEYILLKRAPLKHTIPDDSLLGKMPDYILAKKWKFTAHMVRKRRMELGIPTYQSSLGQYIPEKLLGTMPDKVLAAKLRIPYKRIILRRLKLGIPNFKQSNRMIISKKKLRLFRKNFGLIQKQGAKRSGLSTSLYRRLEIGVCTTTRRCSVDRIAKALHCRVEDFARPLLTGQTKRS
ncbi:MAG: transcriptional regulator [Planctomycetes bacterium]|nr:transcriptional regulator [Planctomycetota bacterium]